MAITPIMWRLIAAQAKQSGHGGTLLCAGYPDILVPEALLDRAVDVSKLKWREDSAEISKWHGTPWLTRIPESGSVFEQMGYSMTVIDIAKVRGPEIVLDLNYPQPMLGEYDLVIDCGTCEHVFNAGQAMVTLAEAVKPGGAIIQVLPLNAPNHGFWNASPTLMQDFYDANGFRIHTLWGVYGPLNLQRIFELEREKRFRLPDGIDSWMMCVATRDGVGPTAAKIPIQRKYLSNPTQKATA